MTASIGDAAQIRVIGEQIAEAIILKMRETERPKVEVPAWAKWMVGVGTTFLTTGVIGLGYWMVGTLSEVQLSVRELNTQLSTKGAIEQRFQAVEQRVARLESDKKGSRNAPD